MDGFENVDKIEVTDDMGDPTDFDEWETLSLVDEEGNEIQMAVIDVIEHEGNTYLLVAEEDELDDDDADVSILKQAGEDGEDIVYEFLDDEGEIEKVLKLFQSSGDDFEIIS